MRKILLFVFIIFINFVFSQNKNCDCVVGVEPIDLKMRLAELGLLVNDEIPKEYQPLLPKKDKSITNHKILKDSASFWFIQPHIRDHKSKYSTIITKKLSTTFFVIIQFNGQDSIPVFTEADKKSKIIRYLIRSKEKNEENDYWFAGCKNNHVKILINVQEKNLKWTIKSGWICKENYLHE